MEQQETLVPIRMIESFGFCPRQAWYRFVANEDPLNWHMERGLARHDAFEEAERKHRAVYRSVAVVAPQIGVQGVIDEVRLEEDQLFITEVKTARLARNVWSATALQLAVQRLALEEQVGRGDWFAEPVPSSDCWRLRVYYTSSRTYREVPWTDELGLSAVSAARAARRLLDAPIPPEGLVGPRCHQCQFLGDCLPFDRMRLLEAAR